MSHDQSLLAKTESSVDAPKMTPITHSPAYTVSKRFNLDIL